MPERTNASTPTNADLARDYMAKAEELARWPESQFMDTYLRKAEIHSNLAIADALLQTGPLAAASSPEAEGLGEEAADARAAKAREIREAVEAKMGKPYRPGDAAATESVLVEIMEEHGIVPPATLPPESQEEER